jgi:prefoldin subunit 5
MEDFEKIKSYRICSPIPEGLIIKKAEENSGEEVSVFDLIAFYAKLKKLKKDIYANSQGEEFIRNEYGFQPATRLNLKLQVERLGKKIEKIEADLQNVNKDKENLAKTITTLTKTLELKEAQLCYYKEHYNRSIAPIKKENDYLKNYLKALKQELNEYKQVSNSIVNKLTKLEERSQEEANKHFEKGNIYLDFLNTSQKTEL